MSRFLDYFGLWTAINMIAWFTLWWTYDKQVTVEAELTLLMQTSLGATALTLAVWGITRASRIDSAVPRKYSKAVEDRFDSTLSIDEEKKDD